VTAVEIGDLAVRNYAAFHERLSDEAQLAAASGNAPLTRRRLMANATLVLRAMQGELDDPKPEARPHRCPCKPCRDWIETKGEGRTPP
jgi:hypothetical protein